MKPWFSKTPLDQANVVFNKKVRDRKSFELVVVCFVAVAIGVIVLCALVVEFFSRS